MKFVKAFDELLANSRLIIIVLIVTIIGAVVVGIISLLLRIRISVLSILGLSSPANIIYKLILSVILGIFYMFTIAISIYSYSRRWSIIQSFSNSSLFLSDSIIAGIALGLVTFVFSYIPIIGLLIYSLVMMGLALSLSISEKSGLKIADSMDRGFSAIPQLLTSDALSLLILYIFCILSFIPILNIFTIPYVAILSSMLT